MTFGSEKEYLNFAAKLKKFNDWKGKVFGLKIFFPFRMIFNLSLSVHMVRV